jgi:hypothetical protein
MGKVMELTKAQPSNTEGVTLSAKVPKVMLEILFYGDEENKEQNKIMLDNLQKQLAKPNNDGKARIFWCTDKEKTDEEKKQFLVENSECLYYTIVSLETQIDNNFVRKHLSKIENLSKAISEMKAMNIIPKKK